MSKTRRRVLYVATEATYGVDPNADGSSYTPIPTYEIGDLADEKTPLPTGYFTGRTYPTAPIPGPDGWSFTFSTPLIGLSTAQGDGDDPSGLADDWLDLLLTSVFGAYGTLEGEAVVSSGANALELQTDIAGVNQVVPVYESGVPTTGARTQWVHLTSDAGDGNYGTSPDWAQAPSSSAIAYGTKVYNASDASNGGTLSFTYVRDDATFTLTGGKVTGLRFMAEAGQQARIEWTVRGDGRVTTGKGSLPGAVFAPANTPIKSVINPVYFGGTNLGHVGTIEADLGVQAAQLPSVDGTANGRGADYTVSFAPTVTVNPLISTAAFDYMRNATQGRLLVQLGRGVLASSKLNTVVLAFGESVATQVAPQDQDGVLRNTIQFQVTDDNTRFIQVSRA